MLTNYHFYISVEKYVYLSVNDCTFYDNDTFYDIIKFYVLYVMIPSSCVFTADDRSKDTLIVALIKLVPVKDLCCE